VKEQPSSRYWALQKVFTSSKNFRFSGVKNVHDEEDTVTETPTDFGLPETHYLLIYRVVHKIFQHTFLQTPPIH
jgi:hypothetical protein